MRKKRMRFLYGFYFFICKNYIINRTFLIQSNFYCEPILQMIVYTSIKRYIIPHQISGGHEIMVKVLKFGGSSLADAEQFKKVAAIIKAEPERRYVVASAPGKRYSDDIKVTDMLYACYDLAESDNEGYLKVFEDIKERYNGIIKELGIDLSLEDEFEKVKLLSKNKLAE